MKSCFLYPGGDYAEMPRKCSLIKPMDELSKLGDNWDDLVVRTCSKELPKCSEHEFLLNCGLLNLSLTAYPLKWSVTASPLKFEDRR